jgi:hypothetical protein
MTSQTSLQFLGLVKEALALVGHRQFVALSAQEQPYKRLLEQDLERICE